MAFNNVTFKNNYFFNEGMIYLMSITGYFVDTNSIYQDNSAAYGGVIYIYNSYASFSGSTFINNYA